MNDDLLLQELVQKVQNLEERFLKLESCINPKLEIIPKKISIKEFFLTKNANIDEIQKTLLVCYYLEKYEGVLSFTAKEIEDGFRLAKETPPKNINYNVIKNIQRAHLMEAKEKKNNLKAWTLTISGERFVESDFKV